MMWGQPDTVTPNLYNPQDLNRYAYVLGNPIRYNDPTGHRACNGDPECIRLSLSEQKTLDDEMDPERQRLHHSSQGINRLWSYTSPASPTPSASIDSDSSGWQENNGWGSGNEDCGGWCANDSPSGGWGSSDEGWSDNEPPTSTNGWGTRIGDGSTILRFPDYYVFSISVSPRFIPLIGQFLNVTGQVTVDRYGNVYVAGGGGGGEGAITTISGNLSAAWLLTTTVPSESDMEAFVRKGSAYVNAGSIVGGGLTWGNPFHRLRLKDFAVEVGGYTPQVGGSYVYGGLIYNANSPKPWFWQH